MKTPTYVTNNDLTLRKVTLDKNLSVTKQIAKQVFNKDQYHSPMAVLFDIYGNFLNILPLNDLMENKDFLAESLKDICSNPMIGAIALIIEAWTYQSKGKNDPIAKQVFNGEISISSLKNGDKQEALTITMEDIDSRLVMINYPITSTRTKASVSKAKVLKDKVSPNNPGRFSNFFGTPKERAKRATKVIGSMMKVLNENKN